VIVLHVVCFRRGGNGAHQDVVEYLDTGKVFAQNASGDPIMFARPGPRVEYWEGEA
jgi:hypothetical protein